MRKDESVFGSLYEGESLEKGICQKDGTEMG